MIKFDLHIHSDASAYKEAKGIVDKSNVENVDILLKNLNNNEVALFSITDHNRFNAELYKAIDKKLNSNTTYSYVKKVLAGVEFDVKLESELEKCHIIVIFDTKDNPKNYDKIKNVIENEDNILKNKNNFYDKEKFENILKQIGLDTILIACQRKGINSDRKHTNSISDSVSDVNKVIQIGYIQALEYQKPKVQGILKENLKSLPNNISLVSGSDCHDWSVYPHHDKNNKTLEFYHSKAKIKPTFKGLVMAITSPKTRFNCKENINKDYIEAVKLGNETIQLINGINTIIGENGSGKSTLLKLLAGEDKQGYVKTIIQNNKISILSNIDSDKVKYIGQGDIVKKFNEGKLFSE